MTESDANHRQSILQAIRTLSACDTQVFSAAISMMMSNEWKEIDDVFDIGEEYSFTLTQLETAEDLNVRLLTRTIKEIRQTIDSLRNLNGILDEELDPI
ncbi:hypothetical protein [Algoriphagus sp.]|uniref:hypothetical protein n=1 Tax=Algoriphagus sp. TaxID=1872435 RepID=UPI00326BBB31